MNDTKAIVPIPLATNSVPQDGDWVKWALLPPSLLGFNPELAELASVQLRFEMHMGQVLMSHAQLVNALLRQGR